MIPSNSSISNYLPRLFSPLSGGIIGVVIGTIVFTALVIILIVLASLNYGCTYCKGVRDGREKTKNEKTLDQADEPPSFRRRGSNLGLSTDRVESRPNQNELLAKSSFLDIERYEASKAALPLEPVHWVTCSK